MRKLLLFGLTIAALSFTMTSCGNSLEKDAEEISKVSCDLLNLLKDAMSGKEIDEDKYNDLEAKAIELEEKYKGKYPEGSEKEKELQKLVNAKIKECSGMDIEALQNLDDGLEDAFGDMDLGGFEDAFDGLEDAFKDLDLKDALEGAFDDVDMEELKSKMESLNLKEIEDLQHFQELLEVLDVE